MILKNKIITFVNDRYIVTSRQSRFKCQHSSTTVVLSVTDDIFVATEEVNKFRTSGHPRSIESV